MPEFDVSGVQNFNPFALHNFRQETNQTTKKNIRAGKTGKTTFAALLKTETAAAETQSLDAVNDVEQADVTALLDSIHSAGDALKQHPFPDEIEQYKKAIKNFIRFVLQNGFDVEKNEGVFNRHKPQFKDKKEKSGERNKYTTITIIDQKLENLAAGIMAGQTEQFQLLARIDEINGLLINLLE